MPAASKIPVCLFGCHCDLLPKSWLVPMVTLSSLVLNSRHETIRVSLLNCRPTTQFLMSKISRVLKSGSRWRMKDLPGWNVSFRDKLAGEFFRRNVYSEFPHLRAFVTMPDARSLRCIKSLTEGHDYYDSLELLEKLEKARYGLEIDVDSLWQSLYVKIGLIATLDSIETRKPLELDLCGGTTEANPDLRLVDGKGIIYQIVEDKSVRERKNPEAQLVAEAIATAQNNRKRRRNLGLREEDVERIYAMTSRGLVPAFYDFRISLGFEEAVTGGTYPPEPLVVSRFKPELSRPGGLWDVANRALILGFVAALGQISKP